MKILFDGQQLSERMTGVGYYSERVLRALLQSDRAHEWVVLCHCGNQPYVSALVEGRPQVRVVVLRETVSLDYRVQRDMLAKLIPQTGIDLYFSPSFLAAPREVCPSVSVIHDTTYVFYPEFHPPGVADYLHRCVAETCRTASWIIAVSENSKRDIARIYHYPVDRIAAVPHAADEMFFRPCTSEDVARVRERHGLPEKYLLAVNMGNPKKNAPLLLRAFARLPASARAGLKLVIVGEWSPGALDIPKVAREAGVGEALILTGFVPCEDLRCLYAGAHVFCFPSLHEGFGLPALEAMAAGVPVVCSNAASLPEVAGDAARMVSPKDEAGWTAALEQMLVSDAVRSQFIEKGKKRAASFSWEKTARATLEVLEREQPRPRARVCAMPMANEPKPSFEPVRLDGLLCAISVDDVRPEPGFGGCREAGPLGFLMRLYEEFGCKSTLFVPTNWKGRWPLEEHLDWLQWLLKQPCFEVACHGHLHATEPGSSDPGEFRGASKEHFRATLGRSLVTFGKAGYAPHGFKAPGWFLDPSAYPVLEEHLQYVADHVVGTEVSRRAGGRLLRMPYLYTIDEHRPWPDKGLAVLQSHIGFEGPITNAWTPQAYERVRSFLRTGRQLGSRFVTLGELASELAPAAPAHPAAPAILHAQERDRRLHGGEVKLLGDDAGVLYNRESAPCSLELRPENATVVVLSRNRREYLADLLRSIDATGPRELGRVVLLNNCEDDSASCLARDFQNWRVIELNDADHPEVPAGLTWLRENMPDLLPATLRGTGCVPGWTVPRSVGWLRNQRFLECGRDFLISFDDDFLVKPGWWEYYVRFQREFAAHAIINNFGAFVMCRTVPERVGWFDERFLRSHGYEDNDYSARITEARLRWGLGFNRDHDWRSAEEGNPRGSMTGADYFIHRYALRSGAFSARRDEAQRDPLRAGWNARWFGTKWEETAEDTGIFPRPPFMGKFLRRTVHEEPDWRRGRPGAARRFAVPRGRRRYFIDCGAHVGESILKAKQLFGPDLAIVAFEAVPYLAYELARLWRDDESVVVHNAIVWVEDGRKTLYLSTAWSDGSSVYVGKRSGGLTETLAVEAPCLDLSAWLRETFHGDEEIILKLDVEGAEYAILAKMIRDGTIGRVHRLFGELHEDKIDNEEVKNLAALVRYWLAANHVAFHTWEPHGVSGRLVERPADMRKVAAWRPPQEKDWR